MTPPARLLDITRLLSRAGRGLTGVDRVELAYLDALLADPVPLFGLAKTALGEVLLDQSGLQSLRPALAGKHAWGPPDLLSHLARRLPIVRRGAEAECRRAGIARTLSRLLGPMLARNLPHGTAYLNVGHSHLTPHIMQAIRHIPEARIAVMVHDVIPLEYPAFQRAGTVPAFERKMRVVREYADLVIYNSADTARRTEAVFRGWGDCPPSVTALLGTNLEDIRRSTPERNPDAAPYFVALGTIEPRKNHQFLLDVWDALAEDLPPEQMPKLRIIGQRGWNNDAVFARLDALPPNSPISEHNNLSDTQVINQLAGAQALLMPSLAEGFGIPPLEAAALGTPIITNTLAVYGEFLGDIPVYAPVSDRYLWVRTIKKMAAKRPTSVGGRQFGNHDLPTWNDHFNQVLKMT